MNSATVLTFLRQILITVGASLATKYSIDQAAIEAIASGLLALIAIIWGLVTKSKDVAAIKAASIEK